MEIMSEKCWKLLEPQSNSSGDVLGTLGDVATSVATKYGLLFYLVNPSTTKHERIEDVPDYFDGAVAAVASLIAVEAAARWRSDRHSDPRVGDVMASLGSLILFLIVSTPCRALEVILYSWAHQHRVFDFDWASGVTWAVAAVGVDFLFYWFHRIAHETNLGWAGHQVHHGSEDYNLTTSLRQSALLKLYTIVFYLPLGWLGVPLTATVAHMQFNIMYQMWIHTELVTTLGPLEWLLNTPSHHRVHHGSEPWCLDKNYGGVLIIWDRIFGTFQPELKDRPIVYGLVDQPQSLNTLYLETFYYKLVWDKFWAQTCWTNSLKAVFYGPGWTPGAPRLGHALPNPPRDAPPRPKYDPRLPPALEAYLLLHLVVASFVQRAVVARHMHLSPPAMVAHTLFCLGTLTVIGGMYDEWAGAIRLEVLRIAAYLQYAYYYPIFLDPVVNSLVLGYLLFSLVLWSFQSVNTSYKYCWSYNMKSL